MDIKIAISLAGITQREFARRTNYREETISRVLHGRYRPSPEMKRKLAAVLGHRVEDLFEEPKA